jgi:biopolymer transport protein ExbD
MGAAGNDNDDTISAINVTPFVDIILVVLIIFMVTTPIIMKPSINVNLPKAASGDETSAAPLNIVISAAGDIFLNGNPSNENDLKTFTESLVKQKPDTQAIISADKDVPHGRVITVIDTVKSSGITKFAISIDKKQ